MGKVDPKLLEMAEVFHMPKKNILKYITMPAKMPGLAKIFNKKGKSTAASGKKGTKGGAHR